MPCGLELSNCCAVIEQLIVVDYQEGAGGEFVANWLSAHFGHAVAENQQTHPSYVQKWLNSHSLIYNDWSLNFDQYLDQFQQLCEAQAISRVAVPYHLYKYPSHVDALSKRFSTRFVKINCENFLDHVHGEFRRKVWDRILGPADLGEIKFMLSNQPKYKKLHCLELLKQDQLTYQDLVALPPPKTIKHLPSTDIEIFYGDFFVDFDRTPLAYQQLCSKLLISPQPELLQFLIDRNRKNLTNNI